MKDDDAKFDRLRRAWRTVFTWNETANPACPCKQLVAPHLADWRAYESDWLAGAPDVAGLDEQTRALVDAVRIINAFAGRKMVDPLGDAAATCEPGDPRCAPTAGPSTQTSSDLLAELPALRTMAARLDGKPFSVGNEPPEHDPKMGAASDLFGNLFDGAAQAAGAAATAQGSEAIKALASTAQAQIPALTQAASQAAQAELPAIAQAAGTAASPVVAPLAAEAGKAAGKAAVEGAQGQAADSGLSTKIALGAAGLLALLGIGWAVTRKDGKR